MNPTSGRYNVVYMITILSVNNEHVTKLDTTLLNPHALESMVICKDLFQILLVRIVWFTFDACTQTGDQWYGHGNTDKHSHSSPVGPN